ncbi:glutaredoxin family protein [Anaerosalibacter sp. Marseille-P3206]|uniref:glutaredoxin family protein n=1 Tax=Anaerosalibacter sp. Marseille-P3206 TaxID=1871005 RepID=UPI0009867AE8|nr:glutaredoxin family protein [Anaerosalibacter sp. Marseille-P3206]
MNATIYTIDTCIYCTKVKKYLSEKKIKYEEKNVQEDSKAREELLSMGYRTVPVIVLGKEEIVGFDKEKIDKIIR